MLSHLVFSISIALFWVFFWLLWLRQISIFCGVVIIAFLASNVKPSYKEETPLSQSIPRKDIIQNNSLFITWIIFQIGISLFVHYFKIDYLYISMWLIILNMLMRFSSYAKDSTQEKHVFQITYVLASIWMIWIASMQAGAEYILDLTLYVVYMHFAVYAFAVFILWIYYEIEKYTKSVCYVLFHIIVLLAILSSYVLLGVLSFILAQLYLASVYYLSFEAKNLHILTPIKRHITAKDILQWAKVLGNSFKTIKQPTFSVFGVYKTILDNIHLWVQKGLYFMNVIIVVTIITFYAVYIWLEAPALYDQIFYWMSLWLFFVNFILVKKITKHIGPLHRMCGFVIVNFAMYINLVYLAWEEWRNTIAVIWIIRNFANAISINQSKYVFEQWIFSTQDYWYWIGANIASMCVNILLLLQSSFAPDLVFGIIFLYAGLFWLLTYNNMKYIYKLD